MPEKQWTVIEQEPHVLCKEYFFGQGSANTFVFEVRPGELMVVSPGVWESEEVMSELRSYGQVIALVAPNIFHHRGLAVWQQDWPDARCYAAEKAIPRLRKKRPEIREFFALESLLPSLPASIRIVVLPHVKNGECLFQIRGTRGWIWHMTDAILNMTRMPSNPIFAFLLRLLGFGVGLRLNRMFQRWFVSDKRAFRTWLLEELQARPPVAVVLGHGKFLHGEQVASVLQALIERG